MKRSVGTGRQGRILYGINPVKEILKSNPKSVHKILVKAGKDKGIDEILKATKVHNINVEWVTPQVLEKIAGTSKHQGLAALAKDFDYVEIEDIIVAGQQKKGPMLILILDGIEDPQNLGSLVRSANAAGVNGVIISKDRAVGVTPTVAKASAGATELTMIARVPNIARAIEILKDKGVWVMGIEADGPLSIYDADLNRDIAIVIGSEDKGVRRLVKERCDFCLSIPMAGQISSLNASNAGAITLFETIRQRKSR